MERSLMDGIGGIASETIALDNTREKVHAAFMDPSARRRFEGEYSQRIKSFKERLASILTTLEDEYPDFGITGRLDVAVRIVRSGPSLEPSTADLQELVHTLLSLVAELFEYETIWFPALRPKI
jgi:hypothetical protein